MKAMSLSEAEAEAKYYGERYVDRPVLTRHLVDGKYVLAEQMFRVYASGRAKKLRDFE